MKKYITKEERLACRKQVYIDCDKAIQSGMILEFVKDKFSLSNIYEAKKYDLYWEFAHMPNSKCLKCPHQLKCHLSEF